MDKDLNIVDDALKIGRTDELFDSAIKRSGALNKEPYTEDDIKKMRVVSSLGNFHLNTAKTKVAIVRMKGYQDNLESLKRAMERKVRNTKKYN